MISVENPLLRNVKWLSQTGWDRLNCRNLSPNTHFRKVAIQEGPGRFREGKREHENVNGHRFFKYIPQSWKVREGSGKGKHVYVKHVCVYVC